MRIAVMDGQGGGIGKLITEKLRIALGEKIEIIALCTNALATALLLKAGANEGASGESAICEGVKKADIIMGPLSIIVANSMLGEISPKMAQAVAEADAAKILLPLNKSKISIAGVHYEPLPHLVEMMVKKVEEIRKKD